MATHIFIGPVIHSEKREQVTIIAKAAVVVQDGKIKEVIEYTDDMVTSYMEQFPSVEIFILSKSQFLIPGFIDTHIHACQYPNAGIGYDKPLMDWLISYTIPLESRYKCIDFAKPIYTAVVKRTLRCGTTTAVYFGTIHRESCRALGEIIVLAGQRALVGKVNMDQEGLLDMSEELKTSVKETKQFIKDIKDLRCDRVRPIITPRFAVTCSSDLMKRLASLASKHDLHIQTHMSENKTEITEVKKIFSTSYAKVYDDANLLTRKTILAHCIHLEEAEIPLLQERGTSVAHCPNSNICLQSGLCDVRKLLESGINVSLGTDVAGGSSPSILDAIRYALTTSISLSFSQPDYKPLTYHEAFYLATMGGAIALNEEENLGNFAVGKSFDAIIVDISPPNSPIEVFTELTLPELFHKFIYTGDDRNIFKVFVEGRPVHTT